MNLVVKLCSAIRGIFYTSMYTFFYEPLDCITSTCREDALYARTDDVVIDRRSLQNVKIEILLLRIF